MKQDKTKLGDLYRNICMLELTFHTMLPNYLPRVGCSDGRLCAIHPH